MSVVTWRNALGPPLAAAIVAAAVVGPALVAHERDARVARSIRAELGAGQSRADVPACPEPTAATGSTWFRLDPTLDEAGGLVGQRLAAGRVGAAASATLDLAAEAFAAGPVDGRVLVGSDDGRRSRIRVLDAAGGCVTAGYETDDLVRRALLDPTGGVIEFRLDRRSRADLGVWRRSLDGGGGVRLAAPLPASERLGLIFSTELAWSAERDRIVVTSCGQAACLIRIIDPLAGAVTTIDEPGIGEAIGLAGSTLVAYGGCPALPCSVVVRDIATGHTRVISEAAGLATLGRRSGRAVVAFEDVRAGRQVVVVGVDGSDPQRVDLGAARLIPGPHRAASAVEVPSGHVPLGPGGRPAASGRGTLLLSLSTRHLITAGEAIR